jgi:hypothetical protein
VMDKVDHIVGWTIVIGVVLLLGVTLTFSWSPHPKRREGVVRGWCVGGAWVVRGWCVGGAWVVRGWCVGRRGCVGSSWRGYRGSCSSPWKLKMSNFNDILPYQQYVIQYWDRLCSSETTSRHVSTTGHWRNGSCRWWF